MVRGTALPCLSTVEDGTHRRFPREAISGADAPSWVARRSRE